MPSDSKLFEPFKLGRMQLQHRLVLPPLTRNRATRSHLPTDMQVEYYSRRAQVPGSFLITEATYVDRRGSGLVYMATPGQYNDEHVAAWKKVCFPSASTPRILG